MEATSSKKHISRVRVNDNGDESDDRDFASCGRNGDKKDKQVAESDCGLLLEKLNLGPRKKLLVFSLNGLLVHRVFSGNSYEIPKNRNPDGTYGCHLVFRRPFAEEFIQFCLERFEVGIWSSALEKNVDGVLNCVMGKLRERLLFVWDQNECTDSGFNSLEKKTKPLFFKELKKAWDHFGGKFSKSDTLLIDDKPYKALLNPPNTGIFLQSFNIEVIGDNALDPKRDLGKYLDGLADANDVQVYVKKNPFGQPAVSPEHPDWKFYSPVLRKLRKLKKCEDLALVK